MITNTDIARVAHEVNRAHCISIGDDSQPTWDNAPAWQRESAINGVEFHSTNPNAGPEGSHENWLRVKKDDGWKYGPVKDAKKKEHPCFVPYGQLPPEQQAKDRLFVAVVHTMTAIRAAEPDIPAEGFHYSDIGGTLRVLSAASKSPLGKQSLDILADKFEAKSIT